MATPRATDVSIESTPRSSMMWSASGYLIQIPQAGIGSQGLDGFVFQSGGDVFAFLVHVDLGALDDTAGLATVSGLTATCDDGLSQGFAGDILMFLETAEGEVASRKPSGRVNDIHHFGGTKSRQSFAGCRVIHKRLGKGSGRPRELFRIGRVYAVSVGVVDGDKLDLLWTP